MKDGIFAHLLVGVKAHSGNDTGLAGDMDDRIRIDPMCFLAPEHPRGIKLFAFAVERVYITSQEPNLLCFVVMSVVGFERGFDLQLLIELLQIDTIGKLLIRRFCFVIELP